MAKRVRMSIVKEVSEIIRMIDKIRQSKRAARQAGERYSFQKTKREYSIGLPKFS